MVNVKTKRPLGARSMGHISQNGTLFRCIHTFLNLNARRISEKQNGHFFIPYPALMVDEGLASIKARCLIRIVWGQKPSGCQGFRKIASNCTDALGYGLWQAHFEDHDPTRRGVFTLFTHTRALAVTPTVCPRRPHFAKRHHLLSSSSLLLHAPGSRLIPDFCALSMGIPIVELVSFFNFCMLLVL